MRSVGEEERMGAHIQKSLAVLKQVPEGHAFEDLTHQNDPPESENTHQLVREIVPEAVEAPSGSFSHGSIAETYQNVL